MSFGLGRIVRSYTIYADDVSTCSLGYKAGLLTGVAGQAFIAGGACATAAVQSFFRSFVLSTQLFISGGELTGATAAGSDAIEALYIVGELELEGITEAALNAIRTASTLRLRSQRFGSDDE